MRRMMVLLAIALAFQLNPIAAPATVVPDCCVCSNDCPSPADTVCFAEHFGETCADLCMAIGCEEATSLPNQMCTAESACAETGTVRCSDGFDNNVNGLVDCEDPSCSGSCVAPAPALGGTGLAIAVALLALAGTLALARRQRI